MMTRTPVATAVPLSNWRRPPRPNRRAFLRALGLAPALAPFVPLFDVRAATMPRRVVLWFTPHGTIYPKWRTSGPADKPVMGPILEPLGRHIPNLIVCENVKMVPDPIGGNHTKGLPLLWTARGVMPGSTFGGGNGAHGWNYGPSIDQAIVDAIAPKTPYRSLEFGVRSGGVHPGRRMIYRGSAKPLEPEQDPQRAFSRLFGGVGVNREQLEAMAAERRSVLDIVKQDLAIFRNKLASPEQYKLDAHLQSIRDVEERINLQIASCAAPQLGARVDAQSGPATPQVWDQQQDVMVAALACGLTTVASMQYRLGENDGSPYYTWLGGTMDHHTLTHEPPNKPEPWAHCQKIYTWYAEKFARFLDRLAEVPEAGGTMLDNTLVVWGSEVGNGATHSVEKIPFIIAGGKGQGVRTGRALRFGEKSEEAAQHTRILVSMAHFMGATQIETFSEKDRGSGVLPGLFA